VRILIIKFRNIGDVLLVTPLFRNLKHHYPGARIDVAVNKETLSMVSLHPDINEVIIYDREKIKFTPLYNQLWQEICFFYALKKVHYDIVINLTEGDRGAFISLLSRAAIRIGCANKNWALKKAFTHQIPIQNLRHTVETNLDPLRILGIPIKSKKVEIFWENKDAAVVDKHLQAIQGPFIHIHPVSRWLFKCIADETMAKLIDYCELDLGIRVVVTAAPLQTEINKVRGILKRCQSTPTNLSGKLSLKQTAALNKRARLFMGVDTAVMHLSAANDVPVFALFGPSGSDLWGPWDNNSWQSGYTERNGLQQMGKHRVYAESRSCQPCGKPGCNETRISDCLMNLDMDDIKKNIREMLNG
jgi:heptosyltransferase-3